MDVATGLAQAAAAAAATTPRPAADSATPDARLTVIPRRVTVLELELELVPGQELGRQPWWEVSVR